MNLKSFQEFWDSVDWDKLREDMLRVFSEEERHTPSQENTNIALFNQSAALLRQYHEWIKSQLEDQ